MTANTSRFRVVRWGLALLAGAATLVPLAGAHAADVVSFTRSQGDSITVDRSPGSVWAGTSNTYEFKALNNELRAQFGYAFLTSADTSADGRAQRAVLYARALGKIFDFDGEALSAMTVFSGEDNAQRQGGSLEVTVTRNGDVLSRSPSTFQTTGLTTASFNADLVNTGKMDLFSTEKEFSVGPVTVNVKAHIVGSLAVPLQGEIGYRGISGSLKPQANIVLDATGSGGIGKILSAGMKANHVDLLKVSLPTRVSTKLSGGCQFVGDCTYELDANMRLDVSALSGKLEAFAKVPVVSERCGVNLGTILFPIWSCVGIPGEKTYARTIWNSKGAKWSGALWSVTESGSL